MGHSNPVIRLRDLTPQFHDDLQSGFYSACACVCGFGGSQPELTRGCSPDELHHFQPWVLWNRVPLWHGSLCLEQYVGLTLLGSTFSLTFPRLPPEDRTKVDVVFDRLYAEAGPGIAANSNRRNCALTFGVKYVPSFIVRSTES